VVAALSTIRGVLALPRVSAVPLRHELGVFRRPRLWLVLTTSTLVIGATFSAFSFLNPILTEISGFATGTVPLLLVAYGAATVVGNTIHGSFITGGIIISSAVGGLAIDEFGLRAPLWLGAGLALLGILTLVPDLVRGARARAAPAPAGEPVGATLCATAEDQRQGQRRTRRQAANFTFRFASTGAV
jgi:predicted MFS family arabinose efflux permease